MFASSTCRSPHRQRLTRRLAVSYFVVALVVCVFELLPCGPVSTVLAQTAAGGAPAAKAPDAAPRVEFPKPFNTQDEKDELVAPEELVKRMTLPPGFSASLFAAEPDVQQPVGATFDSRGRLWVAEMYTYAESKVNFEAKLRDRCLRE